jgi:Rrf2 family transcriptional regulator, cysteine metabolism repressor
MKLTTKSEYACLALLDLTEHYEKGMIKTEDIAHRKNIPKKYLEQILLLLNKSGYVRSKRGSDGGHGLAKNPKHISVAEIIRLMDGPLAPVDSVSTYYYQKTPIEQSKALVRLMTNIRNYISRTLEKTTFADLMKG